MELNGITKDAFIAFEEVRQSGVTNMLAVRTVANLAGLDQEEVQTIIREYENLMKKFPDVRDADHGKEA